MDERADSDVYKNNFLANWSEMSQIRKPVIAAVSGFAVCISPAPSSCFPLKYSLSKLGGGCELALSCDIILASHTAKFGQPEINLGVIPGGGGSQRLTQAVGKSRSMEMILTGRTVSAQEAADWGMVSRVVAEGVEGGVVGEAVKMAEEIAGKGHVAIMAAKEVVNAGEQTNLWSFLFID